MVDMDWPGARQPDALFLEVCIFIHMKSTSTKFLQHPLPVQLLGLPLDELEDLEMLVSRSVL